MRGVALLQVFLNILLSDAQISLNARFWRFPLKFLLQPRKADAGTVLKFQTGRPKRIGLNFDGKFAYLGFVDHVKAICPKTGGNIETYILDVHARILIFAVRSTSTTRCWFISPEARRLLRLVVLFPSCLAILEYACAPESCVGVRGRTWHCRRFFPTQFALS